MSPGLLGLGLICNKEENQLTCSLLGGVCVSEALPDTPVPSLDLTPLGSSIGLLWGRDGHPPGPEPYAVDSLLLLPQ